MSLKSILCALSLFLLCGARLLASDEALDERRKAFLNAEELIASVKTGPFPNQAEALRDYPLYPLLQYQWLRNNLNREREIKDYINAYSDLRYSDLLRRDWLNRLAEEGRWPEFIEHYRSSGGAEMACRYNWARLKTGHRQEALTEAAKLWTVGYSQPKACDELFGELTGSEFLTKDRVWRRFELALRNDKVPLALYLKKLLPSDDQPVADFWLRVHQNPQLVADRSEWNKDVGLIGPVFAYGVERLAGSDLDRAMTVWDGNDNRFAVPVENADNVERKLGLSLVFARRAGAYRRLGNVQNADQTVREWRVRAALLEGNWKKVAEALSGLNPDEIKQPRWQYWRARAETELGRREEGRLLFERLANDRSLFGFIAAETVNRPPLLSDRPVEITPAQMAGFERLPAVRLVFELKALNRERDAQRQWWYWLNGLDKARIQIAAKLAQRWGWTQTAVFTVAKAEYWDDVALRFPLDYIDAVEKQARQQALDPAIVLGLIRRESVFDPYARSPAGARGLMQIMPQTGRQIAGKLNERWQSEQSLFNPSVNVRYGTHYYKQMLDRFGGHFALAAAAYNAGPGRVDRWMPKDKPVPADIWIETIPYKETREYVAAVLGYAMIYQLLLERDSIRVSDFLKDVLPG